MGECLVKRDRTVFLDAWTVTCQDTFGHDGTKLRPWRPRSQERMHTEILVRSEKVWRRSDRVCTDERLAVGIE